MFTGLVQDRGTVRSLEDGNSRRFRIATALPDFALATGASVACNGVCLTVIASGAEAEGRWFEVDASPETLRVTTLSAWREGDTVNLEPALRVGDPLGGHYVTGHVDGVATLTAVQPQEGGNTVWTVHAPEILARFLAPKGSVTLDGVSLTVNAVTDSTFTLNVIPHTRAVTTFGERKEGDRLNLEVDILARYAARIVG